MSVKRKLSDETKVWWGEEKCNKCTNNAYYKSGDSLLCGVHSRNVKRSELPKNPNAKAHAESILFERQREVLLAASANKKDGRRGSVLVSKLRMMRAPDHVAGFRNVFPNNKHQDRKDGFGCASLSPMRLGPVEHGQPGEPPALSIENYHQFGKAFHEDLVDPENGMRAKLKAGFWTMRRNAYLDPVPHRHKYADSKGVDGNKNVPLFSVHLSPSGEIRRYTYLQSRYFYCHQYELLAKQTQDFATLKKMLDDGVNLLVVGYDGYPVTRSLWEHYNDTSAPFGHELVLYSLLTLDNPSHYPWNRFYSENRAIYD